MFEYTTPLRLADTDAAGVLFFARQFDLIHEAYEGFMRSVGFGLDRLLHDESFFISIVRAESEYRAPVWYGDTLRIALDVERIGQSSYVIAYTIDNGRGTVGTARTVHVCVGRESKAKRPLPAGLAARLAGHLAATS
ncbi:MAG: acyl-CoA thioesterase [Myxococcales bacterium]|nr:acyl-CoA thioesterase [Myxococcales bacterium]